MSRDEEEGMPGPGGPEDENAAGDALPAEPETPDEAPREGMPDDGGPAPAEGPADGAADDPESGAAETGEVSEPETDREPDDEPGAEPDAPDETGEAPDEEPSTGDAPPEPETGGEPAPPSRQILEALLFTSSLPLSPDRLKNLLGAEDRGEVRALVEELRIDYEAGERAFQIEEIAGGYVILTRPEFGEWVSRLKGAREEVRLSRAALETLAVVAYRQPVLRADIEKIRGVGCGPVLRSLLEQGLVKVSGRADLPGSPLLYATTPRFLREFGLRSVKDLPRDREL